MGIPAYIAVQIKRASVVQNALEGLKPELNNSVESTEPRSYQHTLPNTKGWDSGEDLFSFMDNFPRSTTAFDTVDDPNKGVNITDGTFDTESKTPRGIESSSGENIAPTNSDIKGTQTENMFGLAKV